MSKPQAELPVLPKTSLNGNPRERRAAGIPWWPARTAGGKLFGHTFSGVLGSKMGAFGMVAFLIGVTAVAGTMLGNDLRYQQGAKRAVRRAAPRFAAKAFDQGTRAESDGFLAKVASSLGLFREANKGTLPEEDAGADAAAGGGSKGSADASDTSGSPDPAMDPAKFAAQMGAGASGEARGSNAAGAGALGGAARFSSGFGGSGPSPGGFGGGAREAGGASVPQGMDASKLSAFAKQPKVSRATAPVRTGRSGRGGSANLRRLDEINRAGRQAAGTSSLPAASATQTAAWEAQGAQGQSLTGAGAGMGGQPGATLTGPGGDNGEPVPSPAPSGGGATDTSGVEEEVVEGQDVTPWAGLVKWAQILMMIAGLLLLVATVLGMMAKGAADPASKATLYGFAKWAAYGAMALAAIVTLLGVMILAQGQFLQGFIFTAVGALLTFLAYKAAEEYSKEAANAEKASADKAKDLAKPDADKIRADKVDSASRTAGPY